MQPDPTVICSPAIKRQAGVTRHASPNVNLAEPPGGAQQVKRTCASLDATTWKLAPASMPAPKTWIAQGFIMRQSGPISSKCGTTRQAAKARSIRRLSLYSQNGRASRLIIRAHNGFALKTKGFGCGYGSAYSNPSATNRASNPSAPVK